MLDGVEKFISPSKKWTFRSVSQISINQVLNKDIVIVNLMFLSNYFFTRAQSAANVEGRKKSGREGQLAGGVDIWLDRQYCMKIVV